MRRRIAGPVAALGAVLAPVAGAHGFGQRYDLPVPLWLYATGAGLAVALSFVVVALFVGAEPGAGMPRRRRNLLEGPLGRLLTHPLLVGAVRLLSVAFFLLVIAAGLFGNQAATGNLAPTAVWVAWWVGLAYASALLGNVWELVNPLKVIWRWLEGLMRRFDPEASLSLGLPYPERLGVWPGVVLFLAFAWVELVFPGASSPAVLATLILAYSAVTFLGMMLFGERQWLERGEAFTLAFGLLARFAPTEVGVDDPEACRACTAPCRDVGEGCDDCVGCFEQAPRQARALRLRPFGAGLLRYRGTDLSMTVFVLLMLSSVTFDGFTATPAWANMQFAAYEVVADVTAIGTYGLLALPLLFLSLYLLFCLLMRAASGTRLALLDLARYFAFSLVPIALAYHLAHYLTYLLTQGQLLVPLLSDPFGFGWNLLGTADYEVDINVVGARFAWFTAVIAIVLGHIVAVYLAHVVALRELRHRAVALRSQLPMLVLMVGYTVASLWILAQPIVEVAPA